MGDKKVDGAGSGGLRVAVHESGGGQDLVNLLLSKFDSFEQQMKDLRTEVIKIDENQKTFMISCKEEFNKISTNLIENFKVFNNDIKVLKNENEKLKGEIQSLKSHFDQNIQYLRFNNGVRLLNVPESAGNNCLQIFKKICQVIDFPYRENMIDHCYRVKAKHSDFYTVIVKFVTNLDKVEFIKLKKLKHLQLTSEIFSLTGEKKPIYISELLSPYYAQLFKEVKQIQAKHRFKYVWFRNCRIFIRVTDGALIESISSFEDLQLFLEKVGDKTPQLTYSGDDIDDAGTDTSGTSKKISKKRKVKSLKKNLQQGSLERFLSQSDN